MLITKKSVLQIRSTAYTSADNQLHCRWINHPGIWINYQVLSINSTARGPNCYSAYKRFPVIKYDKLYDTMYPHVFINSQSLS